MGMDDVLSGVLRVMYFVAGKMLILSGFAGDDWLFGDLGDDVIHGGRVPTISTEASVVMRCGVTRACISFSAGSDLIGDFLPPKGIELKLLNRCLIG